MMIVRTECTILALRRTFTRKERTVVLFMLAAGVAMKKYRNDSRSLQGSFLYTCVIITARQCTRKQTGFITCKIAEKKPQSTIYVLQKKSITHFLWQKIKNISNTCFSLWVLLNAGKKKLIPLFQNLKHYPGLNGKTRTSRKRNVLH